MRSLILSFASLYDQGGTIASSSNYSRIDNINAGHGESTSPTLSNAQLLHWLSTPLGPGLTAQDLLGKYSEILDVAQIAVVPIREALPRAGRNSTLFFRISQLANRQLCSSDSEVVGAVIIMGTDTLEDTMFGLDLTVNCSKPVIASGAMRPATYISPDGPSNLYQVSDACVHVKELY